jgi:hypothetical protein
MQSNTLLIYAILTAAAMSLSSCELIDGIFEAGAWTGIFIVVLVIAIFIWIVARFRRK